MEKKLAEVTDLRGKLESRAKEQARETLRGAVEGTAAGEILAKIEHAEKEYGQLKKLFEECMVDLGADKKAILVDAIHTFVIEGEGISRAMLDLLEQYPHRKIILTNAEDERMKQFGLDAMPYEVFTLKRNPEKTDPRYFEIMLKHFGLSKKDVVYFEHDEEAVKSAQSVGITAYHYDKDKRDLRGLKKFLDRNL